MNQETTVEVSYGKLSFRVGLRSGGIVWAASTGARKDDVAVESVLQRITGTGFSAFPPWSARDRLSETIVAVMGQVAME